MRSIIACYIVQRDLKPENILIQNVNGKNIYKISDFGIGKMCEEIDMGMTRIGTPVYASPECNSHLTDTVFSQSFKIQKTKGIKNYKSQADVYSIGIMMYQIAFGKLPFPINTIQEIIDFVKNLETNKFTFNDQEKLFFSKTQIYKLIEQMIIFWPHERICFEQLFQKLGLAFQTPQKKSWDSQKRV